MKSYFWCVLQLLAQYFDIYRSVVTNSKKESVGCTVKPVLSGHSKTDKTKVLKTNGSLMRVESIAEFCYTFDLH